MITLYLIRNGETRSNLKSQLQGQKEGKLTARGIKQAESVGGQFSNCKVTKVYSSPLERAYQTWQYSGIKKKPAKIEELKERKFGEMTNQNYKKVINLPPEYRPKEGESLEDLRTRAKKFLKMVLTENRDKSVIIAFAHHEIILSCVAAVINLPLKNFRTMTISNASITQLNYDHKWYAVRINDVGHLQNLKLLERGY